MTEFYEDEKSRGKYLKAQKSGAHVAVTKLFALIILLALTVHLRVNFGVMHQDMAFFSTASGAVFVSKRSQELFAVEKQ